MLPGLAITCPLSIWFFSIPLNNAPILSPAIASSNNFLNISIPVITVFCVALIPTNSTLSPTFTFPLSTLPVATVPRPVIENTSSTDIKNALSTSLCGKGMVSSTFATNSNIGPQLAHSFFAHPQLIAFNALPLTMGTLSPANSYLVNSSLTSNSTKSNNSASSTTSHLFKNTTKFGTFTCLANYTCDTATVNILDASLTTPPFAISAYDISLAFPNLLNTFNIAPVNVVFP